MSIARLELLDIFQWLICSSFQATVLLVLILLARRLIGDRFHVRMFYWLWVLLLVRLVWPLNFQTTFSIFNLVPSQAFLSTAEEAQDNRGDSYRLSERGEAGAAISTEKPASVNLTAPAESRIPADKPVDWLPWLCTVWLAGVGLLTVWVLFNNWRLWRIIKRERLITRQPILELLEDCKARIGLQTVIGIVETDKVSSPCLFGYLRPRLLLPTGALDELTPPQLRYIFMHELAHLKRHDILIGWLMAAVQVLHWFNPAVWFAMSQIDSDRELACDELALSRLGEHESKPYGATILMFLERFARRPKLPAMAGIAENQALLKRRITMIAKFKTRKVSWIPAAALIVLFVGATFTSANSEKGVMVRPAGGEDANPAATSGQNTAGSVQAMIDAAPAESTVEIPAGVYDTPIRVTKSLILKGASRDTCVFKVTANEPAILIDTAGGKARLENVTIQWQLATSDRHENPVAVAVKDTDAVISNCVFRPLGNPQRSPVAIRSIGFSKMMVAECDFTGFDYVICYGEGTKGRVAGCFIRNCGHQGVMLYSGADVSVVGNIITGSKYHAVRTTGGSLLLRDNLIINNKNRGVYLGNKSASGTIENNLLIGNGTGIDGISASRFAIKNNVILKSGYAGISAIPQASLMITQNVIADNPRGVIVHLKDGQADPVKSEILKNVFWNNQTTAENCSAKKSIEQKPDFKESGSGNFSLADPVFEGMGLADTATIVDLWQRYKKDSR